MKIGILLNDIGSPKQGGGWTFKKEFFESLQHYASQYDFSVYIKGEQETAKKLAPYAEIIDLSSYDKPSVKIYLRGKYWLLRLLNLFLSIFSSKTKIHFDHISPLTLAFQNHPVDFLIVFPYQQVPDMIPYAYIHWDCGPWELPEFPEMACRRKLFQNQISFNLRYATCVITGTETGKIQLISLLGLTPDRVLVVPFPIPQLASYPSEWRMQKKYEHPVLFYPAQFWPHKNHITILKALYILRKKYNLNFDLVLSGADMGNFEYIRSTVQKLELSDCVHFPGSVSAEELHLFYDIAFAMIYASCFGPDNLPPLEAASTGCPVIIADYPGAREQMKDCALYFDTLDADDLAEKIYQLSNSPDLRCKIISEGKKLTSLHRDYVGTVIEKIRPFLQKRILWKTTNESDILT
ncbi:MAG: glycosyltransferase family 4 protein [Lentisphaeria bacterium]|nr:glycosyltransferase family 4 protein [Lentisphaeria bacterium]